MTTRQFVTAIQDMNQDFKYFPDAGDNPFLPEDELADIVEAGCPNTWQCQELVQGFDATEHSLTELMEFFECLETAEQLYDGNSQQNKKSSNKDRAEANQHECGTEQGVQVPAKSQKGCQNNKKSNKCKRESQWCPLHKTDSHDLTDCKVLNAQIQNMKASHKTKQSGNQHGSKKHKHSEGKSIEQLNAMMAEAAKQGAKAAMESMHKNKKFKRSGSFNSDDEHNQF